MTSIAPPVAPETAAEAPSKLLPGLVLAGLGVIGASVLHGAIAAMPLIVAAMILGALIGNTGLALAETTPGLRFASASLLRIGIVLLGLRLSLSDVAALGPSTLLIIFATVSITFVGVQRIGRRLGLSSGMALLVASGFSICGNSAIASVNGVADAEEEDVAAAIGLVTLFGTAAVFALPAVGALLGLSDEQMGVWFGAGVQDTAQVIAVASTVSPAALAVATAVKLTRVLLLAPIVAGVSLRRHRPGSSLSKASGVSPSASGASSAGARATFLPVFVIGFLAAMLIRTLGIFPGFALDAARSVDQYFLAAGVVGLGSSVRLGQVRRLGLKPLVLGLLAWFVVGGVSLALVLALR